MWILIDNYDSFTYILHQYLIATGNECRVIKNDTHTLHDIEALQPQRIILSPGPQTPNEAGITLEVLAYFKTKIPILGVCLGHQAIGMHFGATLTHAPAPMHGKTSQLLHNGEGIFKGIAPATEVMRYHSLCLTHTENTPLNITATAACDNVIMALEHKELPIVGVQFHPESIGTLEGQQMIHNWAKMY
jgi:para-aminobenzoate synthetase component 2